MDTVFQNTFAFDFGPISITVRDGVAQVWWPGVPEPFILLDGMEALIEVVSHYSDLPITVTLKYEPGKN